MVLFKQKWLYLSKSGCSRAKLLYSDKSGCIRVKVVVIGRKWFYSGNSGCIRGKVSTRGLVLKKTVFLRGRVR